MNIKHELKAHFNIFKTKLGEIIMPQSLSQVIIHMIYSTKNRYKTIPPRVIKPLHGYVATILRDMDSYAYRVGGTANHTHIACSLPRTITQSDLTKKVKATSSKWMKKQEGAFPGFSWQGGYSIFSVSKSRLPALLEYIDSQEEHHKHRTFKEELRDFLDKYDIDYDEKYLWD